METRTIKPSQVEIRALLWEVAAAEIFRELKQKDPLNPVVRKFERLMADHEEKMKMALKKLE
jgi:hypothetical protein